MFFAEAYRHHAMGVLFGIPEKLVSWRALSMVDARRYNRSNWVQRIMCAHFIMGGEGGGRGFVVSEWRALQLRVRLGVEIFRK